MAMNTEALARRALSGTKFDTYWLDTLEAVPDEPPLERDADCDLLVVGGGFCGLWAAVQAKENNPERDVILIEARSIANGASGRPAAILTTSVMHGIENTERTFPHDVAALEDLGRENMDGFQATVDRYGIECDLEWGGEMKVAIGEQGLHDVNEEHRLYQKYGHDSLLLDREQVQHRFILRCFTAASGHESVAVRCTRESWFAA